MCTQHRALCSLQCTVNATRRHGAGERNAGCQMLPPGHAKRERQLTGARRPSQPLTSPAWRAGLSGQHITPRRYLCIASACSRPAISASSTRVRAVSVRSTRLSRGARAGIVSSAGLSDDAATRRMPSLPSARPSTAPHSATPPPALYRYSGVPAGNPASDLITLTRSSTRMLLRTRYLLLGSVSSRPGLSAKVKSMGTLSGWTCSGRAWTDSHAGMASAACSLVFCSQHSPLDARRRFR